MLWRGIPEHIPSDDSRKFVWFRKFWRRGWDLNPRSSFPDTRFPSVLLKPLGHLSTAGSPIRLAQTSGQEKIGGPPVFLEVKFRCGSPKGVGGRRPLEFQAYFAVSREYRETQSSYLPEMSAFYTMGDKLG